MTSPTPPPVCLGAIGMDQRQRNALRMLFSSKCNNRYVLVEEESSEICILDLDVFGGERLWEEFRQRHPEIPLILVSLKNRQLSDPLTVFVQKPIPVKLLIMAIEKQRRHLLVTTEDVDEPPFEAITPYAETPVAKEPVTHDKPPQAPPKASRAASLMSEAAEKTFVGTAKDIDPMDPVQMAKIHYNPNHYLQGHLQQALNHAVRHNQNVDVRGPWPTIHLMAKTRTVRVYSEERHLRPFCTMPDTTLEVSLRLFDTEDSPEPAVQEYPIAAFFWKIALWASRGRVPDDTNILQPIYLRRWPNFTRLVVTPHALAIAATWADQPRSLADTATSLDIPQRYVFAFYSAAKALQLAGETRRAVDTLLVPPAIAQSGQRGILGRLLDRLRGQKNK
ncbi:MAG: hypothetical protein KZQ75_11255 [Candidatus Thiodiazotropha sp. (ex Myrtea spinifera)]|nr:hypothetical protein [Candidatus Thiodiazotropha sp. (ex Myrtea spinifera)]